MKRCGLLSAAALLLALAPCAWGDGQPFGANGLGLIVDDNAGRSRGMGGAGIASADGVNMLRSNPALLTTFDRAMYCVSMLYNNSSTETGTGTFSFARTDPTLIRFAVPLKGRVFLGMGIAPYTRSDCAVTTADSLSAAASDTLFGGGDDVIHYTDTMTSSGGINVISLETALKFRLVSIGAALDYYFGSTNEDWLREFASEDSLSSTTHYVRRQYSGYGATVGLFAHLPHKTTAGIGYTSAATLTTKGYVRPGDESYDEQTLTETSVHLPASWRIGVSSVLSPRFSTAVDYSFSEWEKAARTAKEKSMYTDTYSLSAGIRYTPKVSMSSGYLGRIPLSAGIRTGNLYYKSYSTDTSKIDTVRETAITIGAEFPLQNGNGGIITSLEAGKRGEESRNGWSETFFMVGFSLAGAIK